MAKYLLLVIIFLYQNISYAQNNITINNYGFFIVQNGIAREINTHHEIGITSFWENYLYFEGETTIGFSIYNIENGAISDWILGHGIQFIKENDLIVYVWLSSHNGPNQGYWIYTFDPVTLILKNEARLYERPFPDLQMSSYLYLENYLQRTRIEIINERLYRYIGENYYLDINFGHIIDLSGRYMNYRVNGGVNNIFILKIQRINPIFK